MKDLLYEGRVNELDIAFTYAVTAQAVYEAVVRHTCDPAAAHILGCAILQPANRFGLNVRRRLKRC